MFPALWVVIGLTAIGGYFLTGKSWGAYVSDRSVSLYLLNAVLRLHPRIVGVFEHNPFPQVINGSLWTVPYEVFIYLLLTPLFFIRRRLAWLRAVLVSLFAGLLGLQVAGRTHFATHQLLMQSDQLVVLGLYFIAGALLGLFPSWLRNARMRTVLVLVSGLGLLASLYFGGVWLTGFFLIPVFVIAFGTSNYPALSWIRKYGDISCGVYIWGFIVQQTLWHFLHPSQPMMLVLSIPFTWCLGFASWHLLEKRALRLKLKLPAPALQERVPS